MKLSTLRPRLQSAGGRLTQVGKLQATARLRGEAAVKRRARWLELHPLCCMCDAEGWTQAATVVDHITPLWAGGADNYEANGQSLCHAHHDAKTAQEAAQRAAGAG